MATLLLESKSATTIKLLLDLAKKLGVKVRVLDDTELEDLMLGKLMEKERTDEFVDKAVIMKILKAE